MALPLPTSFAFKHELNNDGWLVGLLPSTSFGDATAPLCVDEELLLQPRLQLAGGV